MFFVEVSALMQNTERPNVLVLAVNSADSDIVAFVNVAIRV